MKIHFFQRLSFKLARTSLFLVLTLGLLVTCVQVYIDFTIQNKTVDKTINEIIKVSQTSAKRAVHTLDNDLAIEVVKGLLTYPFIHSVEIYDENGNIMANASNVIVATGTSRLTKLLRGEQSTYDLSLKYNTGQYQGRLVVIIDNDLTLRPLYQRAFYMLLSGVARNILLAIALAALFHVFLTRPLFQLANSISKIDYQAPSGKRLKYLARHAKDEIGFIIDSANALIGHLEGHQNDLLESENQLRIILDASPNQVFAIDTRGDFVFANNTAAQFYSNKDKDLTGQSFFELLRHCSQANADELIAAISTVDIRTEGSEGIEHSLTDVRGKEYVLKITLMPFILYSKNCCLIIATDISDRVAAEERIEHLAYFDSLTSLPNRNHLHEQLIQDIQYTRDHGTHGAVLFIDIDDFKRINDTLGHSVGDELLLHLSNKMKTQLRKRETLARLGGDEFILSVPNISPEEDRAAEHAAHMAERLLNAISAPIELGGHFFTIGASIGIATYPALAADIEHILRYADTAMYQAKAAGRNCYRIFEAPMAEEARERVRMESEIRQGIANQEFRFHMQPLIDASTHHLVGAEALIRWEHPENGMIMPGNFIPYLEQSPMVSQVGAQVLDQVCGFLRAGRDSGILPEGFRVSVNISATEFFQPNFVEHVRTTLARHQLDGKFIELEITETVALEGFDNLINKISDLKHNGVTFALDDFGTGYSSLSYLKRLPVDKIKIDKTFIDGVPTSKQDTALVKAVIDIAENLNLLVVVEGVEEEVQAAYFSEMKHVIIQGYWFDAPMSPSAFVDKYLQKS